MRRRRAPSLAAARGSPPPASAGVAMVAAAAVCSLEGGRKVRVPLGRCCSAAPVDEGMAVGSVERTCASRRSVPSSLEDCSAKVRVALPSSAVRGEYFDSPLLGCRRPLGYGLDQRRAMGRGSGLSWASADMPEAYVLAMLR